MFYVDDFCREFSEEKSIEFCKKVKLHFIEGHFHYTKWRINNSKVCDYIQSNFDSSEKNAKQRILEISWDLYSDVFLFDLKTIFSKALTTTASKKNVLSVISTIYDPLGFIQPLLVTMKIILQKIFITETESEEPISENVATNWIRVLCII